MQVVLTQKFLREGLEKIELTTTSNFTKKLFLH